MEIPLLAGTLEMAGTLPDLPTTLRDYPAMIEFMKNAIYTMSTVRADMQEIHDTTRKTISDAVRGTKATLNESDKTELAARLAADQTIQNGLDAITTLTTGINTWEARASRLRREFEIKLLEERHASRTDEIRAELRMRMTAADYDANRNRR